MHFIAFTLQEVEQPMVIQEQEALSVHLPLEVAAAVWVEEVVQPVQEVPQEETHRQLALWAREAQGRAVEGEEGATTAEEVDMAQGEEEDRAMCRLAAQ